MLNIVANQIGSWYPFHIKLEANFTIVTGVYRESISIDCPLNIHTAWKYMRGTHIYKAYQCFVLI